MARTPRPVARTPAGVVLHHFAARGPMFADVRLVVCRALALACVSEIALGGRSRHAATQAGATLGVHAKTLPPAKYRASRHEWAQARHLLTDIERAARELSFDELKFELLDRLHARMGKGGVDDWSWCVGLAVLLTTALRADDEALRVRCARTLLSWTRQIWWMRGYSGRPDPDPPPPSRGKTSNTDPHEKIADCLAAHRKEAASRPAPRGGAPPRQRSAEKKSL